MGNLIEGTLPEGSKVVVVEDLISTGGSSLKAVAALREAGFEVVGMVASYTYGFPIAQKAFEDAKVKLVTLTDYEHVVEKAEETGYIKAEDIAALHEWRKDPANWKKYPTHTLSIRIYKYEYKDRKHDPTDQLSPGISLCDAQRSGQYRPRA